MFVALNKRNYIERSVFVVCNINYANLLVHVTSHAVIAAARSRAVGVVAHRSWAGQPDSHIGVHCIWAGAPLVHQLFHEMIVHPVPAGWPVALDELGLRRNQLNRPATARTLIGVAHLVNHVEHEVVLASHHGRVDHTSVDQQATNRCAESIHLFRLASAVQRILSIFVDDMLCANRIVLDRSIFQRVWSNDSSHLGVRICVERTARQILQQ